MTTLERLEATIRSRRGADPAGSYVARLLAAGRPRIAQKVGEEAIETVIAALSGDPEKVVSEAADLIFHLAVLLDSLGLSLKDVMAELDRREGVSGITEKATRNV